MVCIVYLISVGSLLQYCAKARSFLQIVINHHHKNAEEINGISGKKEIDGKEMKWFEFCPPVQSASLLITIFRILNAPLILSIFSIFYHRFNLGTFLIILNDVVVLFLFVCFGLAGIFI